MKRYEQRGHSYLELTNDGPLVEHEEVRASVARLLVVAEKVPHSRKCSIRAPHAATMDYKPTCNCPRGELIAGLKEMAK